MKLLHAADLHLDSPLSGLSRYEGAPIDRIRGATRAAFENLIDFALAEAVDGLLLAGDIYDGSWRDYSTGLFFTHQLARLAEVGTHTFLVQGNHDAASLITRHLELPDRCVRFSADHPETHRVEDLGLCVHGQSFAHKAVTDDLAAQYPAREEGWLNLGVLHTALTGRSGHAPYAPCTVDTLRSKGYDYWALGHVHRREVVSEDPWIVFPGNLQGRHVREAGPKGATLIQADGGRIQRIEPVTLDVVRWARIEVDVSECDNTEAVLDRAREGLQSQLAEAEGRLLCARVVLGGRTSMHREFVDDPDHWINNVRALAYDVGDVWIEKVGFDTRGTVDRAELRKQSDALGELLHGLDMLRASPETMKALGAEALEGLEKRLPVEARHGPEGVDLNDPDYLRRALDDAEEIVWSLLDRGEAS